MKIIKGGITAPRGFKASGIHCGIKYKNKDLGLIFSNVPCVVCGVFTQNRVKAAPVKVSQKHLSNNQAQAIIVNSGNANCCTGKQGIADANKICQSLSRNLGLDSRDVLIASTGLIGKRLPLEKITAAIFDLVKELSSKSSLACAQAIMTTDTHPKQAAVKIKIGKTNVTIGAIAKGAGMISPNMATMLAFVTTDAAIDKTRLRQALKQAANSSFNLITVEGDTSTNDMVLVLANGLAKNKTMGRADFKLFTQALNFVCLRLAKMIVKDAEGATKLVRICVEGARDISQAKRIAFKVANSPLVKTAIFGENPNWGRIAASAGCADKDIKEQALSIYLGPIQVMQKGLALNANKQRLKQVFQKDEIQIRLKLGLGKTQVEVFTCDLSNKYIKINAEY
jgi:glutamate N-acetyltransferase/amino-acid N-acetyltransferase